MKSLVAFIRLGRPKFLLGGFVLYAIGACWASRRTGTWSWPAFFWGQATITAAQLMTHYANDYFDREVDRANDAPTRWSGGSRVLVAGLLSPAVALRAALVLAVLALLLAGMALHVAAVPQTTALLAIAIVALAWAYSAPPLRFVARGLGELDTALVVTILTPCWAARLQSDAPWPELLGLLLPLALLQIAMLFAINCADARGDAQTGKRTLVVLLGPARAITSYQALLWTFVAYLAWVSVRGLLARPPAPATLGLPWILAPAIVVPLALAQVVALRRLRREPSRRRMEGLAFRAVAMLFLASAATLAALLVAPPPPGASPGAFP